MDFENILDYTFKDKALLKTALTHSSYSNEHGEQSNERLEFLGDAIVDMFVSAWLYAEHPDADEGRLTQMRSKIVCEGSLAQAAGNISLQDHIRFGRGEMSTGTTKPSILADCFEAVIGAVFIDGGLERAEDVLRRILWRDVVRLRANDNTSDYKSKLQEIYQGIDGYGVTYEVIGRSGPDHDPVFDVRALHKDRVIGEGSGHSKKEAEQAAAYAALNAMKRYKTI